MFRILSLTLHEHPFLDELPFKLTDRTELTAENYYSVVIGPNGTGKSHLLKSLITALNDIALLKLDGGYRPQSRFTLLYLLDQYEFFVSSKEKEMIYKRNGELVSEVEVILPSKWLASSVTINDKYPVLNFFRKKLIPQYHYLGIRSASNNAFISKITNDNVLNIIEALKKGKADSLLSVYKALGFRPELQITFTVGRMLKLSKVDWIKDFERNPSLITKAHYEYLKNYSLVTNYRGDNYKKHIDNSDTILRILYFLKLKQSIFHNSSREILELKYEIDLSNGAGITTIIDEWDILSIMLDLELIKVGGFLVSKDARFKFEEASSGESHLLGSLHGIIANIEDNSLVLIDEPEVSLHPNWQIDYLDILKAIFNRYKGVNAVIATHSNLLVSSLKKDESRITSLKRDKEKGRVTVEELDFETYGWDPESILYNVFEVATIRNKYFELDLRRLISLISTKSPKTKEILELKEKLEKYIMPDEMDPLQLVINQAENYLKNLYGL